MKKLLLVLVLLFGTSLQAKDTAHNLFVEDTIMGNVVINHFYDEHGRLVFDQILFYDVKLIPALDREVNYVRAWRLIKDARKQYTPEEIDKRKKEARLKFFEDNKISIWDQPSYGYDAFWHPEFDLEYSQTFKIDRLNNVVTIKEAEGYRKVHFKGQVIESWTQFDPELFDREVVPKEQRPELTPFKKEAP